MSGKKKQVMTAHDVDRSISRMAIQIVEKNRNLKNLAIVGIHTGGVFLAERIKELIDQREGIDVPIGSLDITLYRDDLNSPQGEDQPQVRTTEIGFDIDGKIIILVDDVLQTGRSTRAAMDALIDLGRPTVLKLAVLVDRLGRGVPTTSHIQFRLDIHTRGPYRRARLLPADYSVERELAHSTQRWSAPIINNPGVRGHSKRGRAG